MPIYNNLSDQRLPASFGVQNSQRLLARIVDLLNQGLSGSGSISANSIIKFIPINVSSSGSTQIVAPVSGKTIRVLGVYLMANGSVNVKFQSNSVDITGLSYLVVNTGFVLGTNNIGWFETQSGHSLNINLSDSIAVGGSLVYIEV